jgi:hypothetical protein
MVQKFDFTTDTATLAVYDLESLKHRLNDNAGWWADKVACLQEINSGHLIYIRLGSDGVYTVQVKDGLEKNDSLALEFEIQSHSGKIYIGAGEWITSDGYEPDGSEGGGFILCDEGAYQFTVTKIGDFDVHINFSPILHNPNNRYDKVPKLFD